MSVYSHHLIKVLLPLFSVFTHYYRQQIFCLVRLILIKDILHLACPLYYEQLSRLLTTVSKIAVAQVFLLQVCHVYKRHSPGAEAEDKHVTGIVPNGFSRQIEVLYPLNLNKGYAPLYGLVHAAIDMPERMAVFSQAFLYRHLIVGAQNSHVERCRVARQAAVSHLRLIKFKQL